MVEVAMAEATSHPATLPPAGGQSTVVVKKYANRRLYNTETSSYITLENLAEMIRGGRDFVVYDAKTGEDITRGVLTQIIVEEESKGSALLPTTFLRQLIGFYGDSLQGVVPRYLEHAMTNFARQQQQMRQAVQQTFTPFMPFGGVEEMSRQNLAMIERAMSLFNPFARSSEPHGQAAQPSPEMLAEVERLHREVESLRSQLAVARADAVMGQATHDIAEPSEPDLPAPPVRATRARKGPVQHNKP
jgi:polyhydroxyalkanoate synthesis repressor PhaR